MGGICVGCIDPMHPYTLYFIGAFMMKVSMRVKSAVANGPTLPILLMTNNT